jgi:hypothetical protein
MINKPGLCGKHNEFVFSALFEAMVNQILQTCLMFRCPPRPCPHAAWSFRPFPVPRMSAPMRDGLFRFLGLTDDVESVTVYETQGWPTYTTDHRILRILLYFCQNTLFDDNHLQAEVTSQERDNIASLLASVEFRESLYEALPVARRRPWSVYLNRRLENIYNNTTTETRAACWTSSERSRWSTCMLETIHYCPMRESSDRDTYVECTCTPRFSCRTPPLDKGLLFWSDLQAHSPHPDVHIRHAIKGGVDVRIHLISLHWTGAFYAHSKDPHARNGRHEKLIFTLGLDVRTMSLQYEEGDCHLPPPPCRHTPTEQWALVLVPRSRYLSDLMQTQDARRAVLGRLMPLPSVDLAWLVSTYLDEDTREIYPD